MMRSPPRFGCVSVPRSGGRRHGSRLGLTLLEVVVALAIFLIAMVPIWRLVTMGSERALDVQQQTQASTICQAKLDSVKSGAEQLNGSGTVTFGTADWNYTIESTMSEVQNLYQVKVTVKLERGDGRTIEAVLNQLVLDPNYRGSTVSMTPPTPAAGGM